MSLENLDHNLHDETVPLGNKADKKVKPGKKQKNRGTFTFQYQYLPFGELSAALMDRSHHILEVIATKTPHDGVAQALIALFQSDLPRLSALMRLALTYEIDQTPSSEQLFRTDSMATKLMKASSKLLGSLWLFDAIQPFIAQLCQENLIVEVDPARIQPGSTVSAQQSMEVLTYTCKQLLTTILSSFNKVPAPIQDLIRMIAQVVASKFPESKIQAISGYVFLRFFGPGISAPSAFGLGVEPKEEAHRHLLLAAKIIQNIANGTTVREEFLMPLKPWIEEQYSVVNQKLLELAEGPSATSPLPIPHQSAPGLLIHYKELVQWILANQPVLDRHGITDQEYSTLKSAVEPYQRALAAVRDTDGKSHHHHHHHIHLPLLTKSKSKK